MKKLAFMVVIITVAFLFKVTISSNGFRHMDVKVENRIFDSYVADKEDFRENGLSGFKKLDEDEAMIFIFPRADIYGIWMKDMLFSIDIVWLDEQKKVVAIAKDISPDTFPKTFYPDGPSLYVLEFSAGTADRISLQNGAQFSF